MADPRRHESENLGDYEVLDASDTLNGDPGDDPLDRGVATPDRWSAGLKHALKGDEDSESLDELLDEEEPDDTAGPGDDSWDENAPERDVARYERDDDPSPRAGRLVSPDSAGEDDVTGTLVDSEAGEVARDAGIDGGGASAEEAAVHVTDEFDDE